MKYLRLVILLFLYASAVVAQKAEVFLFTEDHQKVTIKLNGELLHSTPSDAIKITGLKDDYYKLVLIFQNSSIGEKEFDLALQQGMLTSYSIRKNNNGDYVLRYLSQVPINDAEKSSPSQLLIEYNEKVKGPSAPAIITASDQKLSESSTEIEPVATDDIDAPGSSGHANSVSDEDGCETVIVASYPIQNVAALIPILATNYSGATKCAKPDDAEVYAKFLDELLSKKDESTRLTFVKNNLSTHCFYAAQVRNLCEQFSFEDDRLEIAKAAFQYTYDVDNYHLLHDIFNFETSIEELNTYISSMK
jgi:hypothetical protein